MVRDAAGDGPEVGGGVRVVLVRGAGFLGGGGVMDVDGHGGVVYVTMDVLDGPLAGPGRDRIVCRLWFDLVGH